MDIDVVIKNIILKQLEIDENKTEILLDTNLQNIGMDSIKFIKLIVEIEGEFDIEYPDDKLLITESGTLNKIITIVGSCLNSN